MKTERLHYDLPPELIAREPLANGFLSGKYGRTSRFLPEDVRSVYSAEDLGRIAGQVARIESSLKPGESLVQHALGYALEQKAVLNGIAHDPTTGTLFVTGKLWESLFEIEIAGE